MDVTPLAPEIAAFERDLPDLLRHHSNKFVVYKGGMLFGAFDTFDNAAMAAIKQFGRGPYLIRQVLPVQPAFVMPASVAYRPMRHAAG